MVKTIESIVNQHSDGNLLIVTHSIALKLLMDYFEKNSLENLWSTPPIPSTSLTLVKINNEFNEVVYKYDTSHILLSARPLK